MRNIRPVSLANRQLEFVCLSEDLNSRQRFMSYLDDGPETFFWVNYFAPVSNRRHNVLNHGQRGPRTADTTQDRRLRR